MAPRYKRGDKHPSNAELFFLRYGRGREVWVTEETLTRYKTNSFRSHKLWIKTPKGRESVKRYDHTKYNKRHRESRLAYYKQPHVRERYRNRYHSDPTIKAKASAYLKRQRRDNLWFRVYQNLRGRLHKALRRPSALKSARTFDLIGCSISALRVHLENQFTNGMTWENYGPHWHIDHRLPLAMFDLTDEQQQRIAFHFENLRPLLATENHRKSDHVTVDGKEVLGRDLRNIVPFKAA